jgi:hypothetical protein
MNIHGINTHREQLIVSVPGLARYLDEFRSINKRWGSAITVGKIEVGCMSADASGFFGSLLQDMLATKGKYSEIQSHLVDAIVVEISQKLTLELTAAARFAINILKRNLFERTADVGYLATDGEIVEFLKSADSASHSGSLPEKTEQLRRRLAEYQNEYTVYNEIIILDSQGQVRVNLAPTAISGSDDQLLRETLAIDLHDPSAREKYIETFRPSDLRPGCGDVLLYSQKIEDQASRSALGVLCLCFDFNDEMERIFKDLHQGNPDILIAILDSQGHVMSSNAPASLPCGTMVTVDLEADFRILSFQGKSYIVSTVATEGYQGFYGLTWYGMAMIDINSAFRQTEGENGIDEATLQKMQNFSGKLSSIKKQSEELFNDMKLDSINGQVKAGQYQAKAFVEVLHFVTSVGEGINEHFSAAIGHLQQTILHSLFNDVQFRAFQGNNIADRNLYERANDVCWWALTPLFRSLLVKHREQGLSPRDQQALTDNLQYINDLYTPYLRIVVADVSGVILATSTPPEGLEERIVDQGIPAGQALVGTKMDSELVRQALHLPTSRDYCVSPFSPTPLYGGRPTYIFSTSVRDPDKNSQTVGVIQIVFDAEPQFQAMLFDILPKDENHQPRPGAMAFFADRKQTIIASTSPEYPAGSILPLAGLYFQYKKGERTAALVEMNSRPYVLGIQVSEGYREFKN